MRRDQGVTVSTCRELHILGMKAILLRGVSTSSFKLIQADDEEWLTS